METALPIRRFGGRTACRPPHANRPSGRPATRAAWKTARPARSPQATRANPMITRGTVADATGIHDHPTPTRTVVARHTRLGDPAGRRRPELERLERTAAEIDGLAIETAHASGRGDGGLGTVTDEIAGA